MRAATLVGILCALPSYGCGARTDARDADASVAADARADDAGRDAGPFVPPPLLDAGPPPPRCAGRDDVGRFEGAILGAPVRFDWVTAGIEPDGSHSCPRLFLRAGDSPTFTGDYLEIEAYFVSGEPAMPGLRPGWLNAYVGGELWSEEIMVDVRRADGLIDRSLPMDRWRASAEIHHHDATTDLDAVIVDASYCNDFAICI